jgi:DNA-binding HxlR family transcriptional regulator
VPARRATETASEPAARRSGPSVLDPACESRQVLDLVADKWSAIIVCILARRRLRYSELQRSVGGISQKMLTQTLRRLERDGLIQRFVHPVVPPRVEYALSELGETLVEPLQALCRWAEMHMDEVRSARLRFLSDA